MIENKDGKEYIKVTSCSNPNYWYSDHVGTIFEVYFKDSETDSVVIANIDGTGKTMGSVFNGDFEYILSDVVINDIFTPPEPPKSEDQLKYEKLKKELETTQNALNEIIMSTLSL